MDKCSSLKFCSILVILLQALTVCLFHRTVYPKIAVSDTVPVDDALWTLVIVNGLARTIDFAAQSLLKNVVLENLPCDVLIAMDEKDSYSTSIQELLKPYLLTRPFTVNPQCVSGESACAHIEFRLTYAGLQSVTNFSKYSYLVNIRTDAFIGVSLCVSCLHGTGSELRFGENFQGFSRKLSQRLDRSSLPMRDLLYYYIVGGSSDLFAYSFLNNTHSPHCPDHEDVNCSPRSPWCPASLGQCLITQQTKHIKDYLQTLPPSAFTTLRDVQHELRKVHSRFPMIYLAGASWLRFGEANLMKRHLLDQVDHYGRSFNEVGFQIEASKTNYRRINEAQVRLSIWNLKERGVNVTMVEMLNFVDYQMSFWKESKFKPLSKNFKQLSTIALSREIGVFLLRSDFINPPSPALLH